MCRKLFREDRGYSLVTFALLLGAFAAVLALVVDIGNAYVQQWQMQNAADAGALAGTQALALGEDAQQAAIEYAQRNGAEDVTVTVDAGQKTVSVWAKKDFPTFVASILGIDTLAADSPAAAIHCAVSEMSAGVYPIAVNWQNFVFGQEYDIFAGSGPGNFGWLTWHGSPSVPTLCTSLTPPGDSETFVDAHVPCGCYGDGILNIGDWVQGKPGISNSSCVRAKLDWFVSTGTPMTIVVWNAVEGSGNNVNYRVAGFAQFVLVSYRLPGQNRITGRFIQWMIPTTKIDCGPGAPDYGVYGMKLSE